MADDHSLIRGTEARKNADSQWSRMLFVGTVLLVSHLLQIKPSEINAGGLKIDVENIAVIHGGLALIFLYYFFSTTTQYLEGHLLSPFDANRRMMRAFLRSAKRPFRDESIKRRRLRTPKEAKKNAWWSVFFYNLFVIPYVIVIFAILTVALGFAVLDTFNFASYAFDKAVSDAVNEMNIS